MNIDNNIDYYTMIPNKFFYDVDGKSLLQQIGDNKALLVIEYLHRNTNRAGETMFTLEHMITSCGFKLQSGKGRTNDSFKTILKTLQEIGILVTDLDMSELKATTFVVCKFDLLDKELDGKNVGFFKAHESHKQKVFNYVSSEKISHLDLYLYYCYLNARMYRRNDGGVAEHGGRAEACYPSYNKIGEDIGLADNTIKKYNDILVGLNLVRIGNPGLRIKGGIKQESPNIYVLYDGDEKAAQTNINEAIKTYRNACEGYTFDTTREYKNNDRVANGLIARVDYLEKKGKATQEQIEKRDELVAVRRMTMQQLNVGEIFELKQFEGDEICLSQMCYEIYCEYDCNDDETKAKREHYYKLFEMYSAIEDELGLYSCGEITVDYAYYKWVMTNYTKEKHNEFVNYVQKKKDETRSCAADLFELAAYKDTEMLLSEICFDIKCAATDKYEETRDTEDKKREEHYYDLCKKYEEIEKELGLVVCGRLTVDYSFYKEIMCDYTEEKHDELAEAVDFRIEMLIEELEDAKAQAHIIEETSTEVVPEPVANVRMSDIYVIDEEDEPTWLNTNTNKEYEQEKQELYTELNVAPKKKFDYDKFVENIDINADLPF